MIDNEKIPVQARVSGKPVSAGVINGVYLSNKGGGTTEIKRIPVHAAIDNKFVNAEVLNTTVMVEEIPTPAQIDDEDVEAVLIDHVSRDIKSKIKPGKTILGEAVVV
jgi:hypothetical protein